jgi:hypothetical protein
MPSRPVTVTILVFWLAAVAWFCRHDLWPRLRPGDRPPYTLDLAQEVSGPEARHWNVFHNGKTIGQARSWVGHNRDDDTYELFTRINFFRFELAAVHVQRMKSMYRVTRDGYLRAVDADMAFSLGADEGPQVTASVQGEVRDGVLTPHWKIEAPALRTHKEGDLQAIEVSNNRSVLSPMQPWNRLLNVQENRTWRIELFDPLMAALSGLAPVPGRDLGVRTLEAGVLQGTRDLSWNNQDVPCLVIEYRGEGIVGRTFVRQSDGLVLRQQAVRNEGTPNEDSLALERLPR